MNTDMINMDISNISIELVQQEFRNLSEALVEVKEEQSAPERDSGAGGRNLLGLFPVFLIVLMVVLRLSWTLYKSFGQKTRTPPPRRMYVGSRQRASLTPQEPTIYVSPSNMPPPPKYECMAPPSYEEVVGIHYPNYQIQPITQPINAALAHTSNSTTTDSVVVITVNENASASHHDLPAPRRTSVTQS